MRTLKTKEERRVAELLVARTFNANFKWSVNIESGEGEGQGELCFDNFFIVGQDTGDFAVSYAEEVPGAVDQPTDVDIVEVGLTDTLRSAIGLALSVYATLRLKADLEAELEALEHDGK